MSRSSAPVVSREDNPIVRAAKEDPGSIKETIESILVAFILAFIFRAFVVEAFVIPTGSMAPTLLGAHMRFTCPDCGYSFDVNYSSPSMEDSEDMHIPLTGQPDADVYCPNCGFLVDRLGRSEEQQVHYGDRILVLKYLYLLHPPQRWDVVVFKSPDAPQTTHYQQNFIKRLVGLPGEKLMVLDGDLYVSDAAGPDDWHICKKTERAQEALWRIVYDNDFYPQAGTRMPRWMQPWQWVAGSKWDLGDGPATGRTFHFDNPSGAGRIRFNPEANGSTQTLTDYLVYDVNNRATGMTRRPNSASGSADDEYFNAVSDLKLSAYYTRNSGNGPLRLMLSKFEDMDHTFTAELSPTGVRLIHQTNSGQNDTMSKTFAELGIAADKPMFIEFVNSDYRVTLKLNGKQVFEPLDYPPNVEWLKSQWRLGPGRHGRPGEAAIEADSQSCSIAHLSLWRSVYYLNRRGNNDLYSATPGNPVVLKPHEFFVMGDNTMISQDARYWTSPIQLPHEGLDMQAGRVPEQFMLGKAVFVYWPAGFRFFDHDIIPNFGDMRWIH
jgi:signal peptidase I